MDGGAGGAAGAADCGGCGAHALVAAAAAPAPAAPAAAVLGRSRKSALRAEAVAAAGGCSKTDSCSPSFISCLGFVGLFFGKFCNDRLQSGHWLCSGFADGYARDCGRRRGNRRAQADQAFFRFLFPLWAAETLGGRGEPADGILRSCRPSHKTGQARTPPWRRACVHTVRIAGRGDPRWFSLCGCGPEFVANRSLGGIVTAARTREP